jgi:hypothetical protein
MTPTPIHSRPVHRSAPQIWLGTFFLVVCLLGCGLHIASSTAANRRALELWQKHETVVELAIKGQQRNEEFLEACLFFERVAGISIHVNIFTLGAVPEAEAANDLKLIRDWYRQNHARLYWDEASGQVKVSD